MAQSSREDIRRAIKSGNINWSDVISTDRGLTMPYQGMTDEFVEEVYKRAGLLPPEDSLPAAPAEKPASTYTPPCSSGSRLRHRGYGRTRGTCPKTCFLLKAMALPTSLLMRGDRQ